MANIKELNKEDRVADLFRKLDMLPDAENEFKDIMQIVKFIKNHKSNQLGDIGCNPYFIDLEDKFVNDEENRPLDEYHLHYGNDLVLPKMIDGQKADGSYLYDIKSGVHIPNKKQLMLMICDVTMDRLEDYKIPFYDNSNWTFKQDQELLRAVGYGKYDHDLKSMAHALMIHQIRDWKYSIKLKQNDIKNIQKSVKDEKAKMRELYGNN